MALPLQMVQLPLAVPLVVPMLPQFPLRLLVATEQHFACSVGLVLLKEELPQHR
jgi:hypothetical protein